MRLRTIYVCDRGCDYARAPRSRSEETGVARDYHIAYPNGVAETHDLRAVEVIELALLREWLQERIAEYDQPRIQGASSYCNALRSVLDLIDQQEAERE